MGGEVARGADHERALAAGVAERVEDVGDLPARDAGVELEREVDDLRALAGGVADARADRDAVAGARAVEHAHGHDPRPVGEAGDAEAVAGRLGDRARDVRAVAVEVVGVGVVVDEVVALDEAVEQVGRALVAVAGRVGDAGVEHRDLDAEPAGAADRVEAVPRVGRVDPEVLAEVPLHALPAAERAAGLAGVVRDEARSCGRSGSATRSARRAGARARRSSAATLSPSRILSTRVRGAKTCGSPGAGRALRVRRGPCGSQTARSGRSPRSGRRRSRCGHWAGSPRRAPPAQARTRRPRGRRAERRSGRGREMFKCRAPREHLRREEVAPQPLRVPTTMA